MKFDKILIAFLAIATLFSCNRKVDFQHTTFVSLDQAKISVAENCLTMAVPVYLYNPSGDDIQVTISATDATAKVNDDYEIVKPANGILTFSGDVDSLAIEIAISDKYVGTITKNKKFDLKITSPDVPVGAYANATVTIRDLDHPLDKIGLFGKFTGNLILADGSSTKVPTELVLSAPEDDETFEKVIIEGIEPYLSSYAVDGGVQGRYDADSGKLIVKKGQVPIEITGYSFTLTGTTDGLDEVDIEFQYDQDKHTLTLINPYGVKCIESEVEPDAVSQFFSLYLSGTLTKE